MRSLHSHCVSAVAPADQLLIWRSAAAIISGKRSPASRMSLLEECTLSTRFVRSSAAHSMSTHGRREACSRVASTPAIVVGAVVSHVTSASRSSRSAFVTSLVQ
jgi:hypothetical protein